jgi:hypothetical protein
VNRRLKKHGQKKAIFLVPTIDLVDQQANAVETWLGTGEEVCRHHGGRATPSLYLHRVLVSTPSAFLGLQKSDNVRFGWDVFSICVFDEVHHVLKDHPYRHLAVNLKGFVERNQSSTVQIVGLSASLTYAIQEHDIRKVLGRLCFELCVTKMCAPTAEELIAGGYTPKNSGNVEIMDCEDPPEGVVAVRERKPHLVHKIVSKRIERRCATEWTLLVWDTIQLLEKHVVTSGITNFKSPLGNQKLSSWEEYACRLKRDVPTHRPLFQQLEDWYVCLRLLFVSWEEEEPLAQQWVLMTTALTVYEGFDTALKSQLALVQREVATDAMNFAKLRGLCDQLEEKKKRFGEGFRCIVFVQQRISAYIVTHFINTTERLRDLGLQAGFVASKGSKVTPSIKVTPTKAKDTLQLFRQGGVDVLVATSVAEEVSATTKLQ